jgi:hypothetical protein
MPGAKTFGRSAFSAAFLTCPQIVREQTDQPLDSRITQRQVESTPLSLDGVTILSRLSAGLPSSRPALFFFDERQQRATSAAAAPVMKRMVGGIGIEPMTPRV